MKIFLYFIIILSSYINTFGQSPDWTVDESKYIHSMTFVICLNHNGTPLSDSNDKVAAFVNGEIRGSSNLYYSSRAGRYLAYLVVRSNTINETVTFKFYDSVNDQVVNASRTVLFGIDRHYGDGFQAFCLSSPDLSSEANIKAFSFSGSETAATTIANAKVSIASNVYIFNNIVQLNAIFELSTGASLYDNGIPKKIISSGSNSIDFSTSQIVNVLSADETTLKAWTIEIIPTWYVGVDADADGFFGSTTSVTQSASPGIGYSTTPPATPDCDDSDAAINPNTLWYLGVDVDVDGFFESTTSVMQCTSPGDGYSRTPQTSVNWNGITNTDWNNATNWSLGSIPFSIHTVSIPSGLSNYPIIPTNTDAAVNTITIASGASLTLLKGSTLSVIGNFTETSGTVTLNSDSDEFSSLLVSGTTFGNIVYNRYVNTVEPGEWDLIGSPVSGLSFSTFLQNANIARNGSFYAAGSYDNTNDKWTNATSATAGNLQLGEGYQMATTSGGTLTFTGAIANGDQSVTIQNNDAANTGAGKRWNLIANPFASYLYANSNADATNNFLTINSAAIDDTFEAIYGHKADGTGYTIYNNTSLATYIAPGQGFFVAAAGSGEDKTISFTKAMQTITGTDDFIASKTSATSYELELEMHQDAKKLGDTKFYFKEGLTLGLDPGYDAGAFNQGSALSSRLVDDDQGIGMGINAMSIDHMGSVLVPLVVNQEAGNSFAIRIANHTLPSDINVYVEDVVEKTLTRVTAETFTLTPQTKLSGTSRFYLHFTRSSLSLESIVNTSLITAYKGIGNDYISIEGLQQFSKASKIILYNFLGMKIIDKTINTPSQKETISTVGIKEGAYILQINYGNQVLTKRMVINKT
jgi:hypothetical protein